MRGGTNALLLRRDCVLAFGCSLHFLVESLKVDTLWLTFVRTQPCSRGAKRRFPSDSGIMTSPCSLRCTSTEWNYAPNWNCPPCAGRLKPLRLSTYTRSCIQSELTWFIQCFSTVHILRAPIKLSECDTFSLSISQARLLVGSTLPTTLGLKMARRIITWCWMEWESDLMPKEILLSLHLIPHNFFSAPETTYNTKTNFNLRVSRATMSCFNVNNGKMSIHQRPTPSNKTSTIRLKINRFAETNWKSIKCSHFLLSLSHYLTINPSHNQTLSFDGSYQQRRSSICFTKVKTKGKREGHW